MSQLSRRNFLKTVSLASGAALAGFSGMQSAWAQRAKYRLKFANNLPVAHPMNIRAKEMAQHVLADTGGEVDIRIFPSSQLGNDTDTLSQIRVGAVDFFMLSPIILGTFIPAAQISGVGFAFSGYDQVWPAMDGALGSHVRKEIAKSGTLTAFENIWDNGFRIITTSTAPIRTAADLKGVKLRVPPSPLWTSMFEALQASPTTINFSETYSALQTRIADGQENPITLVESAKLYEVQKYVSTSNHMWDGFWCLANQKNFAKLPQGHQDVIRKRINEAGLAQRQDLAALSTTVTDTLTSKGMAFNEVDTASFRKALRDAGFYTKWHDAFGEEAWTLLESAVGKLS
ncbi:TRAP transporter substrate-binding protein [Pollutimonas bauzanensis]|uniref:Tripartite ATP-independent transporter solute receptor, DctP family n=1 Tax=Pollutimonas bauzanensis TaxID=658167 RepID=A0A1M5X3B8_9BURK|nr:TRAP transporter substrate-binding protein [Pollutimonas bauzanensis]SHH94281.1 tripartite ATP-independent transporter solute receptor, DctP family [Pollutimonas bauzanensis]